MTITEAKKIIEMCVDAVTKTIGEETKVYVNKDYILQILDMVETPVGPSWPDIPSFPWNPMNPGVTYTDGQWVWRKLSTGTGENDPGEWHLIYEKGPDPNTPWCGDINGTGYNPHQNDISVSCDDFTKYARTYTSAENINNVTITDNVNTPTHQYVEKFTTADSDNKTV